MNDYAIGDMTLSKVLTSRKILYSMQIGHSYSNVMTEQLWCSILAAWMHNKALALIKLDAHCLNILTVFISLSCRSVT